MLIVNQFVLTADHTTSHAQNDHSFDSSQFSWIQTWSDDQIKHWQELDAHMSRIVSLKSSYTSQPPREIIARDSRNVKSLWSLWDSLTVENSVLRYI